MSSTPVPPTVGGHVAVLCPRGRAVVTPPSSVLLLGMHKSGTSLVAETLHRSGIPMGDVEADADYDGGGTWECRRAQELNRRLLDGLTVPVPDVRFWRTTNLGLDRAGYPRNDDSVNVFRAGRAAVAWRDHGMDDELATYVADRSARQQRWGFKDPRTCLTLPCWLPHLPADLAVVLVYREPAQVLDHLLYTRGHRAPVVGGPRSWAALRSWAVHNALSLDLAATLPAERVLVLRYDALMGGDDEFDKLAGFLDTELVDARRSGLYRRQQATARSLQRVRRLGRVMRPDPQEVMARLESRRRSASTGSVPQPAVEQGAEVQLSACSSRPR